MSMLSNECGMLLCSLVCFLVFVEWLVQLWKDCGLFLEFVDWVVDVWIKVQVYWLQIFGMVIRLVVGGELGVELLVIKVFWFELDVYLYQIVFDLCGVDGELVGLWIEGLLFVLGGLIYVGINEIQCNIIVEWLLGLLCEKM